MPKGIYKHPSQCGFQKGHLNYLTEETKKKMSDAHKGKISGFKGKKQSEKVKEKLSKIFKGRKLSENIRRKMSNARRGEKCHFWKGGITSENIKIRQSIEFCLWREAVFARDNWTCQKCGIKGGKLHPHHIQNFAQFPELRFAIDNGITLSKKAHREFHRKYGIKNNTREQLEEFLIKI